MIHINEGNSIAILVIVKDDTDFFKEELDVESGYLTVYFMIDDDLRNPYEWVLLFFSKATSYSPLA